MTKAFEKLEFDRRGTKPRDNGLTMMIDWGIGVHQQKDLLDLTNQYVDLAKIAVGLSGIIDEKKLREKMKVYRSHDVEPFPGGMFLELAERQDKLDFYLQECERIGYRLVEVSDNVARIPPDRRSSIIELAREEFGFKILNEVGSKKKISDFDLLAEDVEVGQQVGAWKTLVEAAEFFEKGNGFSQDLAKRLTGKVSPKGLIFELPGRWIEGVHSHQIYQMTDWLFDYFGPEVNIGNVAPAVLLQVEAIRQGVGPSMKF